MCVYMHTHIYTHTHVTQSKGVWYPTFYFFIKSQLPLKENTVLLYYVTQVLVQTQFSREKQKKLGLENFNYFLSSLSNWNGELGCGVSLLRPWRLPCAWEGCAGTSWSPRPVLQAYSVSLRMNPLPNQVNWKSISTLLFTLPEWFMFWSCLGSLL